MARGVNKVILVGNLGNDPDMKYTQGGMAICRLSLATTSVWNDRDGNKQERTEWHTVKLFGKLAEIAGEYLKKGRQVYIEGSIRYDRQETDSGTKYFTDIIADELQMLGSGDGGGGSRGGSREDHRSGGGRGRDGGRSSGGYGGSGASARQGGGARSEREPARPVSDFGSDFADDDIPF